MKKPAIALAALALLAGCASYDGRGLVPGKSGAGDVQALMGAPSEQVRLLNGDSVWFYPRMPYGRQTYAVRFSADGVVRGVDQRLTVENMHRVGIGTTTMKEVRELLGPPWRASRLARQQREVWEYTMHDVTQSDYNLYVQFSGDGVVREVLLLRELVNEPCAM